MEFLADDFACFVCRDAGGGFFRVVVWFGMLCR
jgi:hypothetical protein